MDSALATIAFLSRSPHRIAVLQALMDAPRDRAELRDVTEASSSTLGRILNDFADREWITRADRRYETTPTGELLGREFVRLVDTVETVEHLHKAVASLPIEAMGVELDAMRDATITTATESNPFLPVLTMASRLAAGGNVRLLVATAIPQVLGAIQEGVHNGSQPLDDVDSLSFDPRNDTLYGADRRPNAPDLLFRIDPETGRFVEDAFTNETGAEVDYLPITYDPIAGPSDIDDIAIDDEGKVYAVFVENSGGSVSSDLATLDLTTGEATKVGDTADNTEGLTIDAADTLFGTTGLSGEFGNSFFEMNKSNGDADLISGLDKFDYESIACPTTLPDEGASNEDSVSRKPLGPPGVLFARVGLALIAVGAILRPRFE